MQNEKELLKYKIKRARQLIIASLGYDVNHEKYKSKMLNAINEYKTKINRLNTRPV